jgi:hypothetical protein
MFLSFAFKPISVVQFQKTIPKQRVGKSRKLENLLAMGEVGAAAQNPRPERHQESESDRLAPLGSNDDELERAQARAAARRRRSSLSLLYAQAAAAYQAPGEENVKSNVMDREQILALYQNCIKLASENVRTL